MEPALPSAMEVTSQGIQPATTMLCNHHIAWPTKIKLLSSTTWREFTFGQDAVANDGVWRDYTQADDCERIVLEFTDEDQQTVWQDICGAPSQFDDIRLFRCVTNELIVKVKSGPADARRDFVIPEAVMRYVVPFHDFVPDRLTVMEAVSTFPLDAPLTAPELGDPKFLSAWFRFTCDANIAMLSQDTPYSATDWKLENLGFVRCGPPTVGTLLGFAHNQRVWHHGRPVIVPGSSVDRPESHLVVQFGDIYKSVDAADLESHSHLYDGPYRFCLIDPDQVAPADADGNVATFPLDARYHTNVQGGLALLQTTWASIYALCIPFISDLPPFSWEARFQYVKTTQLGPTAHDVIAAVDTHMSQYIQDGPVAVHYGNVLALLKAFSELLGYRPLDLDATLSVAKDGLLELWQNVHTTLA